MDKLEFKFKGLPAALFVALLLLTGAYRFLLPGELEDEALRAAVVGKLSEIHQVEEGRIKIEALSLSKPLLTFALKEKVLVRADYRLVEEDGAPSAEQRRYFRSRHQRLTGKWRPPMESSAVWFYLNFY